MENDVRSIQFRKDYVLIETIQGCIELDYDESPAIIDNLKGICLHMYGRKEKRKNSEPAPKSKMQSLAELIKPLLIRSKSWIK